MLVISPRDKLQEYAIKNRSFHLSYVLLKVTKLLYKICKYMYILSVNDSNGPALIYGLDLPAESITMINVHVLQKAHNGRNTLAIR